MNRLYWWLGMLIASYLTSCGPGIGEQNMPVGGTPFSGSFNPGIGNAVNSSLVGCTSNDAESITFVVAESGPTAIYDSVVNSQLQNKVIILGNFSSPVNQNNPCFRGTIQLSNCTNIQSATIVFNGCSVYLLGNSYVFNATYIINATGYVQTGVINVTK